MDSVSGIDTETFRNALSRFASGVTVVTSAFEGAVNGSTVSAFASVSLVPPLILVCIDDRSLTRRLIVDSGIFAVNVLRDAQTDLARHCAGKADGKMNSVSWSEGDLGVPLIEGALMRLECRLVANHPGGDHSILVGQVVRADVGPGAPLLHYDGVFRTLANP